MMGPAYQLRDVAQETIYQNTCCNGMLPKVIAAKSPLVQAVFVLSIAFVGTVADLFGVRFVYLFSSFMLLLTALIGMAGLMYNKHSIEIDKTSAERREGI